MKENIQTLNQLRAWNIWLAVSEQINNGLSECQDREYNVKNEMNHFKKFIELQRGQLHVILGKIELLYRMNKKYNIGKEDCINEWLDIWNKINAFLK